MTTLTAYEQQQVNEIAGWKAEPPLMIVEALDAVTRPFAHLAERFVPDQAVSDAINIAYRDAEILAHRADVAKTAGVADVHELRQGEGDLARCDRLAQEFTRQAARRSAIRAVGAAGGPLMSMEIAMVFALKTVHTVGFCYGFTPEDPREKQYVLQTLLMASAGSMEEKQKAIVNLRSIEDLLVGDVVENVVENEVEGLVERFLAEVAESSFPLLGHVIQCATSAVATRHTGEVAMRVFQERWLRAHGKVEMIAPDPRLARSRLRRLEDVVSACIYWPSYYLSFGVTFPTLLLTRFLPKQNTVISGFADGGSAAMHDASQLAKHLRSTVVAQPNVAAPVAV
jgi:hypothetical protein